MKTIAKRLFDLIVKLVSVKTIPAVIFSVGYLREPTAINSGACLLAWALVVGVRYAEKVSLMAKTGGG